MTSPNLTNSLNPYDDFYDGESEWRRLGALDKTANILALCASLPHERLLEIGAGEGSILQCLAEARFAAEMFALEVSSSGLRAIQRRELPGLVEARLFDGSRVPYADASFDLAVLSHVLEHVEHPRQLINEASRVARHVFIEVPLEDTWRMPRDYRPTATGHINAFSEKTIRRLVQTCGLTVQRQVTTNPSRAVYAYRYGRRGLAQYWVKRLALRLAPALATLLWTYHTSLVCSKTLLQAS
jgi:ubiquinone/menaquinone biosynthesis C-methylase UbiE